MDLTRVLVDGVDKDVFEYFIGIYLNELFWLLTSIKSKCDRLFSMAQVPEKGFVIQVDLEVHSLIKSIVDDSTQVANLIQPHERRKDEPAEKYAYRKHRGEYLANLFRNITISEMLDHKLRDSIEHFDERLDRLAHTTSQKIQKKGQILAHNMVFSDRAVFQPFPLPIRVFVSSERKFYNMNWFLDIGRIYSECCSMLNVLKENENLKKSKEPGGMLIVIPQLK